MEGLCQTELVPNAIITVNTRLEGTKLSVGLDGVRFFRGSVNASLETHLELVTKVALSGDGSTCYVHYGDVHVALEVVESKPVFEMVSAPKQGELVCGRQSPAKDSPQRTELVLLRKHMVERLMQSLGEMASLESAARETALEDQRRLEQHERMASVELCLLLDGYSAVDSLPPPRYRFVESERKVQFYGAVKRKYALDPTPAFALKLGQFQLSGKASQNCYPDGGGVEAAVVVGPEPQASIISLSRSGHVDEEIILLAGVEIDLK